MFYGKDNLKSIVIDLLGRGGMKAIGLVETVKALRPRTTKQGIYKVLRSLKNEEIVVFKKKEVSLSSLWIKKLEHFIETAKASYNHPKDPGSSFLFLKEGEKISYFFKTFEDTDRFWIHAFDLLGDNTDKSIPVLIYNPHEWFLLARKDSELRLFDHLTKNNRNLQSLVAEKDPLDIYVKRFFNGKTLQYYSLGKYPYPSKYNVNVFGDFLIEVDLDQAMTNKIDSVYKKYQEFSPSILFELLGIIRTKGRNKLTISRNKKKAEAIRKLFKKYFP